MVSARSKRAQNKKHYIKSIKELKAKAKKNYKSNPERKRQLHAFIQARSMALTLKKRRLP